MEVEQASFVPEHEPSRRVVCSALRHQDGRIICSARHFDKLMHRQIAMDDGIKNGWRGAEQGFIDQFGVFMTRTEAWTVAFVAGQIRRRVGGDTKDGGSLFSENLY